jgi:hypothetical protein
MRRNRLALAAFLMATCAAMFTGCNCGTSTVAPPLPPLSAVHIAPPLDTLVVGTQRQFTAVALDTDSVAVSGAAIGWSTTDAGVATVSGTGLVTAVGEGVAQIIASASDKSDSATVAVFFQPGWYAQPSGTTSNLWGAFFLPDWAQRLGGGRRGHDRAYDECRRVVGHAGELDVVLAARGVVHVRPGRLRRGFRRHGHAHAERLG